MTNYAVIAAFIRVAKNGATYDYQSAATGFDEGYSVGRITAYEGIARDLAHHFLHTDPYGFDYTQFLVDCGVE